MVGIVSTSSGHGNMARRRSECSPGPEAARPTRSATSGSYIKPKSRMFHACSFLSSIMDNESLGSVSVSELLIKRFPKLRWDRRAGRDGEHAGDHGQRHS